MNRPTAYERMCKHHAQNIFKKGAHTGDAPLDPIRRYGHKRIRLHPTHAEVVLHKSVIFRAFPDGTVQISSAGWRSNTTRDTINVALLFTRTGAFVWSTARFGLSQWHYSMHMPRRSYAFHDGLTLAPDGSPINPVPFKRRIIDPVRSKPFAVAAKPFRQAFPLFHAALQDTNPDGSLRIRDFYDRALSNPAALARAITDQPEHWPVIIAKYGYADNIWGPREKLSANAALRSIMAAARADMYVTIDHTVTQV